MNADGEKINAMKHIENARQHLASHRQLGRIRRFKSAGASAMNVVNELAAALEQLTESQKQLMESHKQSEKKYQIYLERLLLKKNVIKILFNLLKIKIEKMLITFYLK